MYISRRQRLCHYGAGEQLKRIKYDVDENNLKVFNVHFDNNEELVTDGEPDVVCLSK